MESAIVVPQLPPGIGGFRVIARLGCGGMAEVFLARRTCSFGFERRVVVKRMLPHLAHQPDLAMALVDEARVLARMRHPNIVAVEEIGTDDHAFFLVMEHLRGATLSAVARELRSRKAALDPAVAAHIAAEIAAGLHEAHELRDERGRALSLVHRDVSPHNVFLTIHGEVKLLDFGIAHFADRSSRTQTAVAEGKLAYMAPEQFAGGTPDRRIDVFALGVVLHELLAGRRLFSRATDMETVQAVLETRVVSPSELAPGRSIPRALDAVCMRALARDPEERFPTAAAFRDAVRAATRGLDVLDLRDRVAELARANAAEREDRRPPPVQTATLPEVPWALPRAPRLASESDGEVAIDVAGARRQSPRATHTRLRLVSNKMWAMIAAPAAIAIGCAALLFAIPSSDATHAAVTASSRSVAIQIVSEPPGADVMLGGRALGRTPVSVEVARDSTPLPVRVELEGHGEVVHDLVPDRPRKLRVILGGD